MKVATVRPNSGIPTTVVEAESSKILSCAALSSGVVRHSVSAVTEQNMSTQIPYKKGGG